MCSIEFAMEDIKERDFPHLTQEFRNFYKGTRNFYSEEEEGRRRNILMFVDDQFVIQNEKDKLHEYMYKYIRSYA